MIRVGVTGGIGSGKTTFCKVLEEQGAFVAYADDIAKKLMVEDESLISEIKKAFGDESYHKDGNLNRAHLAKEAFEKNRVEELNAIVHPRLWKHIEELADLKEKEGVEVFVKEAALLLKEGRPSNINVVILVLAKKEDRINRVVKRDQTQVGKVEERMQKQQNFEELESLADIVVRNNGSLVDLKHQAESIYSDLTQKL
jgi:dephospho-CoA kinase